MIKSSVKKPFTVLVAVIMIIALGIVSLTNMTADLLPDFSLPYMIVITTYPGASPEKVEESISKPMESALGTINGVKTITSNSAENYSSVQLEFEDDTDMSAALVKVSNALDSVKSSLPEGAGTPSVMEISLDMMASVYVGVSYEGKDEFELSQFVKDNVVPTLERQDGVANVNSVGLVAKSIAIELDEAKVQDLNDKILALTNKAFRKVYNQLQDAKKQLEDGQQEIYDGYDKIADGRREIIDGWKTYNKSVSDYYDALDAIDENIAKLKEAEAQLPQLLENKSELITGMKAATLSRSLLDSAAKNSDDALKELERIHDQLPDGLQVVADSKISETIKRYNDALLRFASATDNEQIDAYVQESINRAYDLIKQITSAASQVGINFDSNTTFGGLVETIVGAPRTLSTSARSILTQGIAAYNALREAANLKKVNWTADTITYSNVLSMESEWDGLWGSAYSFIRSTLTTLETQKATLEGSKSQIDAGKKQLEDAETTLDKSVDGLIEGQKQIDDGWKSYNDSVAQVEKQRKEALKTANADKLVSLSTLSQLIYAQNFEMPAGYIDDENDNSWLIKVGENFTSADDMRDIVLTKIDDIGDVRLSDVANITYIDNIGEQYAKIDGENGVLLAIFKSSSASANDITKRVDKALAKLQEDYPGFSSINLLDQGDYINMLVQSVLESMILGAILAVIILALFLKDVLPTIVVAISIPLSVLLAIVCIYFTGLTLNIMTLSGLALGIGMLVDNSIVVIENIYRIKLLGNSAAKSSVLGAKEVAGPIISSTLTTICVFLPIVFASGLVKELIMPMCLTVTYCLVASLIIALTVVPTAGATLLKNSVPKEHPLFDKAMEKYGTSLKWCLNHKKIPLTVAIALLLVSVIIVVSMGVVMIPNMSTEPIQMSIEIPEETDKTTAYQTVDNVVEKVLQVDGVENVGAMPSSALIATTGMGGGNGDYHNFIVYIMLEGENPSARTIKRVVHDISQFTDDFDCDISLSTASLDTSALLGSGLSIQIYGNDLDTLVDISEDIKGIIETVDGYENVSNAMEEGDDVIHLYIDKDAAMRAGLSVAQLYAEIATRLTTEVTSTTLTVNGQEMDVQVINNYSVPKVENLLDMKFSVMATDASGNAKTNVYTLSEFATIKEEVGVPVVSRENMSRYISVTASIAEGKNASLLARELKPLIEKYELPDGYRIFLGGESDTADNMVVQMSKLMALGFLFIYLVMVAQFQSLLSPFIILFTIPLAFTGGLLALSIFGEQLSLISIMGFMILMGTVVNNGIVFVDYANQLRIAGMEREEALIETGKTRMRPILMTALTTILAMSKLSLGVDMAGQMGKGMALVIMGGLLYATIMTLYIVPIIYDMLFKRQPLVIDVEV